MNFRHFILTRFNVNIEPTDFRLRLDNAWLSLRFDLFQKFCFPSVRGQSSQDFTWLVLFDEKTPERFRRLIDVYKKYPNFRPVFCGEYKTIKPQLAALMRDLAPDVEWLLSTRLDNDDALACLFVECLRQLAGSVNPEELSPEDTLFINFTNGVQYCESKVYAFEDVTNAFISLLERRAKPRTVFWVDHPSIYEVSRVMQARTKPLWLQNVHGTNLYNYIRGELTEDLSILKDFKLEL